ncbi:MAG: XdhC family protein [Bacteroidia bacterium]
MSNIWTSIHSHLSQDIAVMLLIVFDSQGSSPGRQGFMMAVAENGKFEGSIGGGIMEIKLVEKAKSLLKKGINKPELIFQYHDKEHAVNQSGMICSGHQVNAFVPLNSNHIELTNEIALNKIKSFTINPEGISKAVDKEYGFRFENEQEWTFTQTIESKSVIHIIGGGHVGLALSEAMHFLGFYVIIYDDRENLQTIEKNKFADKINILPTYDLIGDYLKHSEDEYVAIMTVGYRSDKQVVKKLLDHQYKYLGLLGSKAKIKAFLDELESEGIAKEKIDKLNTPIGININSKTPQEIAISIAAEIILEKNKSFPSARGAGSY